MLWTQQHQMSPFWIYSVIAIIIYVIEDLICTMSIIHVWDSLRNSSITMANLICTWNLNLHLICFLIFLIMTVLKFKGLTRAKEDKPWLQHVKHWYCKCPPAAADFTKTCTWKNWLTAVGARNTCSPFVQDREDNSNKNRKEKTKSDKWQTSQPPHLEQMRPNPLSKMHHSCQKLTAKIQKFQSCLSILGLQLQQKATYDVDFFELTTLL